MLPGTPCRLTHVPQRHQTSWRERCASRKRSWRPWPWGNQTWHFQWSKMIIWTTKNSDLTWLTQLFTIKNCDLTISSKKTWWLNTTKMIQPTPWSEFGARSEENLSSSHGKWEFLGGCQGHPGEDRQQRCVDHGMKDLALRHCGTAALRHCQLSPWSRSMGAVLPCLSQDQGRRDGIHRRF